MAKLFHASTIRRPPPEDAIVDPNDALLDAFYDESRQSVNGSCDERRSSMDPLVEEIYPLHHDNENINALSYRRRRVDDNDKSHPLRNNGYNSVVNNEAGNLDSHRRCSNDNNSSQTQNYTRRKSQEHLTWNKLNAALFVGQALLSAATSAPITLVPTMALSLAGTNDNEEWNYAPYYNLETLEVYDESGTKKRWIPFRIRTRRSNKNNNQTISSSSIFASHLTSIVTLVTAFGKFINGVLVDVAGARRLLLIYGTCTCLALLGLRYSTTPSWAIGCCAAVEFFNTITWPAGIVILGAHYGMNGNDTKYERALYVTSLASRCGSLLAIPLTSLVIKWTDLTWRGVAGLASMFAFGGVVVFYFYLTDSPGKVHDPQNPIRVVPHSSNTNGAAHRPYHPSFNSWTPRQPSIFQRAIYLCSSVFYTVLPSIRAILSSRVFWAVAIAHAGATMVISSQRVLGTYFRDTSFGVVSESKAGAMTVFLSLGMLGGLLVGGKAFARAAESEQGRQTHPSNTDVDRQLQSPLIDAAQVSTKNMIAFFYCLSICMCYMLAFLAMPFVRRALHLPVLVLILQVFATLGLGFGVAVQYYHIPAIVGATFGEKNRGLYSSYTDGVAALVSSIVWRIIGGAVEEGNPQSGGWAYGWAAVALLLLFSGTIMVKIVELYFVGGGWRHDKPQDHDQITFPTELPADLNSSWMEDEIFSIESSPLRGPNILSRSALEFIGSPVHSNRRKLTTVDSRDEVDTTTDNIDLLGIDEDGSFLFPSLENSRTESGFVSFNSMFEPKDIRDNDSCIRESSVFDDPCNDSFEL
ncbi:hypothetical protein ACHAXR_011058 [Thalassiosira sp. AJA248-18]